MFGPHTYGIRIPTYTDSVGARRGREVLDRHPALGGGTAEPLVHERRFSILESPLEPVVNGHVEIGNEPTRIVLPSLETCKPSVLRNAARLC